MTLTVRERSPSPSPCAKSIASAPTQVASLDMGSAMTMDAGIKRWAERMGASSALRNASSVNSPLSQHGGTGAATGGGGPLTKTEVNQALIPYGFVHEQIAYLTRVFCDDSTHAAVRSMDGLNRLGARRRTGCGETLAFPPGCFEHGAVLLAYKRHLG
jgi:hypothetical protein